MRPPTFLPKPIDKIRRVCYNVVKGTFRSFNTNLMIEAPMKRMSEEKLNQMAEFIHRYVREHNGESPKFQEFWITWR